VPENGGPNSFSGANGAIFSVKCVKVEKISEKVKNFEILRDPVSDFTLVVSNRPTDY
jgi:hypothetical protein